MKLWKDMTVAEKGELLLAHHNKKEIQVYDELKEHGFIPLTLNGRATQPIG